MKPSLLLLPFLLITTARAEEPKAKQLTKESAIERLNKACGIAIRSHDKDVPAEKHPKKVCRCVASNLGSYASAEELELLARSHVGEKQAEAELQLEKHSSLIELHSEALKNCRKDANWKAGP